MSDGPPGASPTMMRTVRLGNGACAAAGSNVAAQAASAATAQSQERLCRLFITHPCRGLAATAGPFPRSFLWCDLTTALPASQPTTHCRGWRFALPLDRSGDPYASLRDTDNTSFGLIPTSSA